MGPCKSRQSPAGIAMRDFPGRRKPFALVVSGLGLGVAGLLTLSLVTFHKQALTSSLTGGPGTITLTFTAQPMNPVFALFLIWVMAIPFVFLFVPWKFYLTTLVAPAFVALCTIAVIVDGQLVAGTVASSVAWVLVGDALVLAGCFVEAIGIVTERRRRMKRLARPPSPDLPIRSAVSRPR